MSSNMEMLFDAKCKANVLNRVTHKEGPLVRVNDLWKAILGKRVVGAAVFLKGEGGPPPTLKMDPLPQGCNSFRTLCVVVGQCSPPGSNARDPQWAGGGLVPS